VTTPTLSRQLPQSLARGAAGVALLRIEQALSGSGTWDDAHAAVTAIASEAVDGGLRSSLFYGAPAVAFVLHTAQADGHARYENAMKVLDQSVHRLVRQRLTAAEARMRHGGTPTFGEYDLFCGLTGLGALLLRIAPGSDIMAGVLRYLVALTRSRVVDGLQVPGWFTVHDPDPELPVPGGHANLGLAHGAAGILAMLALATRQGAAVDGQQAAIECLQDLFEQWRQQSEDGPWWPNWLSRDHLSRRRPCPGDPVRPSWCYGAAGIFPIN
jgi:hypothetical protein